MKKIVLLTAAVMAANAVFSASFASADDISVVVNGSEIETPTPAVIVNDRTLVPLRAISESLGFDISWDGDTRGITVTDGEFLSFMWIDHDHTFLTDSMSLAGYVVLDAPPVIMNDYTMVPLRAIAQMFGADVNWDQASSTAIVDFTGSVDVSTGLAEKFRTYEQVFYQKYAEYTGFVDRTGNIINAEIQLKDGKTIELELYPDIAPITVSNFVKLANEGFYDGLIFHRVIEDFMIQGGGFDTSYNRKEADTITGEFIANGYFNLIPHDAGVISMARTSSSMDSASSQFFIMHKATHSLDGQYAAFGRVINGMENVENIAVTPTEYNDAIGDGDVPVEQQVIEKIIIK